jgi:hypothetical protein
MSKILPENPYPILNALINGCGFDGWKEGQQATAEAIIEWGDSPCPHNHYQETFPTVRRTCPKCWSELKMEVKNE